MNDIKSADYFQECFFRAPETDTFPWLVRSFDKRITVVPTQNDAKKPKESLKKRKEGEASPPSWLRLGINDTDYQYRKWVTQSKFFLLIGKKVGSLLFWKQRFNLLANT
jgi:hypothetical protein